MSALTADRHVTEAQSSKLKELIGPVADVFNNPVHVAAADTAEARGYAIDLMEALTKAGLPLFTKDKRQPFVPQDVRAYGAFKGVFIQVADPSKPPKEATILFDALNKAGIKTAYWKNMDLWLDQYVVTVGIK